MLADSGLLNDMGSLAFSLAGQPMCVYGDPAYPLRIHLQAPYRHGSFPASRGLSRRGKNERRERPLPASDAFPLTHALLFPLQLVTFFSLETQPEEPVCARNFCWNAGVLQTVKVRSLNQSMNIAFQLFNLLTFAALLIQSYWATSYKIW